MKFNKRWFERHQRALIILLNLPVIGQLLRRAMCVGDLWLPVAKITPNAVHYWLGGDKFRAELSSGYDHAEGLRASFYPLWALIHAWDMLIANRWLPAANLGFDTLDQVADASFGYIGGANASYATARSTASISDTTGLVFIGQRNASSTYTIRHAYLRFDTSSLIGTAPLGAIFRATISGKNGAANDTLKITNYAWNSPITTSDSDYDGALAAGISSSVDWSTLASLSVDTPKDSSALNVAWVNETGYTYLVVISAGVIGNSAPSVNTDATANMRLPGDATTAYRPRLIVEFVSSAGWWYFF